MEQPTIRPPIPPSQRANPVGPSDGEPVAHPTTHPDSTLPPEEGVGACVLDDVLPEIAEVARKVGGFKRLSEIAAQLERAGIGQ